MMNSLGIVLQLVFVIGILLLVNELTSRSLNYYDRTKRKATPHHNFRWPNARIPFLIRNSSEPDIEVIKRAMSIWEHNTCFKFIPITSESQLRSTNGNRVVYFKGENCWADVGRHGYPEQYISIGPGCNSLTTVLHEIGHTIGFEHEHERRDRDNYVKVNWMNVEKDNADAFQKKDTVLNVPYDLYSIMHYSRDTFTANGLPTLLTIDPLQQYEIGSARAPSFLDIQLANQIYSCNANCGYRRPCRNGGYIGPDCVCLCPPGFYGKQCESGAAQKIEGCRHLLTDQTGIIQSSNFPDNYGNWEDCIWYIKAPEGRTITLTFLEFDLEDSPFCYRDYLGIRTKSMYQDEGNWFCGNRLPPTFTTKNNELMLLFISDYMINSKGFKAKYQINYVTQRNDDSNCFQRSCYEFLNQQVSHWEAKRLCELRGSQLLMVSSPEESEFLQQRFGELMIGKSFWIDFPYNIHQREPGWKWAKDWYTHIGDSQVRCCSYIIYDDWKRTHCYDRGQHAICEKRIQYAQPKWNKWSEWNQCTTTCGGGTRTRTRSCTLPGLCRGMGNGTKACNNAECPGSFAQGKWTNQSSTKAASENAVDLKYWPRELDGSCSLTEYEWEPWWVVDLGKSQTVVKIVITIDAQRLYRLDDTTVRVGESLYDLSSNYRCREPITKTDIQGYRVTIECSPTPKGRYLSLQKENKYGFINICEIDVFVSALNCPYQQPYLGYSLPAAKGIPVFWKNPTTVIEEKLGKITCSHGSGSVFPIGQTKVTCKSQKKSATYMDTCSFLVNVEVCKNKFQSQCYKIFPKKQTYLESRETCRRAGYRLASVEVQEENTYIRDILKRTLGNESYAFLSRDVLFQAVVDFLLKEKNSTFSNWSDTKSRYYGNSSVEQHQCVVMSTQSGTWTETECKHPKASVCEAKLTGCQHIFNSSCYVTLQSKQGYERSTELCQDIGGELVAITNSTVNKFVKSLVKSEAFIGLTIAGQKNTWKWADGTPLSFTKWIKGYPKTNVQNKECVVIKKSGRWKNVSCDKRTKVVCKTRII